MKSSFAPETRQFSGAVFACQGIFGSEKQGLAVRFEEEFGSAVAILMRAGIYSLPSIFLFLILSSYYFDR
ncbi:MAG: hypothetical protein NT140_00010 [Deltaproteobacteria bacterium]|nr:hypothetical protein [Deltaproteobacteria bacterium]